MPIYNISSLTLHCSVCYRRICPYNVPRLVRMLSQANVFYNILIPLFLHPYNRYALSLFLGYQVSIVQF